MLLSARDLEDGARLSADVCIAGAGAAGITLARDLIDSGLDVIVLAGGGVQPEDADQELYQGTTSGLQAFTLEEHRLRAFGGSTHLWSGWCRPMGAEDFVAREYIPGSGWPLDREALDPYYARAHQTLELGAFDYDAARLAERSGRPLLPLAGDAGTEIFQYSTPTRMHSRYGAELEAAEGVRVYEHGHLADIVAGVTGVGELACATLEGTSFTVEAGRFVLALGGMENARMLLAADDGRGVANGSGQVGVGFMEHPHYYRSTAILLAEAADVDFYSRFEVDTRVADDDPEASVRVMGVLALSAAAREREGLPAFLGQLVAADLEEDAERTGELGPLGVAELLPGREARGMLLMTCRVEQTRHPDSRLTLIDQRDALGVPRLNLNWAIDARDDRALTRSLTLLGAEVARAGLGRLWLPERSGAFRGTPRGGCHHIGTTRMGSDPDRGVVDGDCRSFELDNLYVAGSSLFPTSGAANPTLTIVALAHRLADHLKESAP
ncbi:MAG: GMC family oxidoreductase [Myxococcales bacterium]|nr:GMC family oxidoreductase [Myxococcales bacterium]